MRRGAGTGLGEVIDEVERKEKETEVTNVEWNEEEKEDKSWRRMRCS